MMTVAYKCYQNIACVHQNTLLIKFLKEKVFCYCRYTTLDHDLFLSANNGCQHLMF